MASSSSSRYTVVAADLFRKQTNKQHQQQPSHTVLKKLCEETRVWGGAWKHEATEAAEILGIKQSVKRTQDKRNSMINTHKPKIPLWSSARTNLCFCSREWREERAKQSSAHNKTRKVSITSPTSKLFFLGGGGGWSFRAKRHEQKKEIRSGDDNLLTKPNAPPKK